MFTGPNIVRDGLVLHLDAANEKSFRGEPTTNSANTDTLRTFIEHSPGAYGNDSVMSDAPEKGIGWKKITVLNRGNNFRIAQLPYLTQLANTTRTYSIEIDFGNTSGYFIRGDGTIGFGSNGSSNGIYTATVSPTASNRSLALFLNHNTTGVSGLNDVIYYRYYQVEEKSYATPFTESTRGTTVATGGGWADRSGNSNHGELVNGPTYSSANNGSIVFNGSNTNILLSNPTSFAGPYTILLWAKPTTALVPGGSGANKPTGANRKTLFVGPGPTWNPGIWITSDYIRSHADTQYIDSAINWNTASWKMIGMTYNGTNCQNIFNGEILPVAFTTGYAPPNPTQLLIGAETSAGNGQNWNGNVSLFSVYNRVLTSDEIREVYNATKSRFGL